MRREYTDTPLVGVGVVVFKEHHVLMVRRLNPPRAGQWSLPGGLQHLGETVAEAAIREVHEETGVTIACGSVIDVVDLIERDDKRDVRRHYTLIDVAGHYVSGHPAAADDAGDAAWVPLSSIGALGLWSETVRIIKKAAVMAGLGLIGG